jgi:hypothetical protein
VHFIGGFARSICRFQKKLFGAVTSSVLNLIWR